MFDFKKLKVVKKHPLDKSFSSFVGIRRGGDGMLEFSLPRGFDGFPESDFSSVKNIFFKMYKTFQKFEKNYCKNMSDTRPSGKDSIEKASNAYHFKDSEDNDVILYSKIRMIESIFEIYRDLSLDTVESYFCTGDQIDFSKIENYLDKAIYLDDDVVYIDEMDYERQIINYRNNDLVGMFCFILGELSIELESDVDQKVLEISDFFVGNFLSPDQKIFDEFYFESTINSLKDILCDIDKSTAYKDPQYWMLFEALERFLYGELDMESTQEEGVFWGISNFYQIWEDMCNNYMIKSCLNSNDQEVFYADTALEINGSRFYNNNFGGHHIFLKDGADNPFFIEFRGRFRWMRPDIVLSKIVFSEHFKINIKSNISKTPDVECNLVSINLEKKIIPKVENISFEVLLTGTGIDSRKKYEDFCKDLERGMRGGRVTSSNKKGVRTFNLYRKSFLNHVIRKHGYFKKEFFIIDLLRKSFFDRHPV